VPGKVIDNNVDPYRNDPEKGGKLSGIRIQADDGHVVDLLYVKSDSKQFPNGTRIDAGTQIGEAQDISIVHRPNATGHMTNHIHIQIRKDGNFVDPMPMLRPRK
jgi:murein DD-endopeptidase MepM/ murein hydrolase activator NlpD